MKKTTLTLQNAIRQGYFVSLKSASIETQAIPGSDKIRVYGRAKFSVNDPNITVGDLQTTGNYNVNPNDSDAIQSVASDESQWLKHVLESVNVDTAGFDANVRFPAQ